MTSDMLTMGMRLDALISKAEALPSTVVYGILLLTSVAFSFIILNSGNPTTIPENSSRTGYKNPIPTKQKIARSPNEPQPKWHILTLLNCAMVVGFLASVGKFASDATCYLNDTSTMLVFLIFWSVCLCYFFGFLGISFVDPDDMIADSPSETNPQHIVKKIDNSRVIKATPKSIHPPASSTPVCGTSSKPTQSKFSPKDFDLLPDAEIAELVISNQVKDHQLEKLLNATRAVMVRRLVFHGKLKSLNNANPQALANLPSHPPECSAWYDRIHGANCEIVTGYIPIPVGIVGPLTLNNETVYIPMCTTEGCLVASTNRGCKAISSGKMGAVSTLLRDGITRAPCLRFSSAQRAAQAALWVEEPENFLQLKHAFESTTSFGKLISANPTVAGRNVYLRLKCFSGDAMGMNMVSKGSLAVVDTLKTVFDDMALIALSGNMCTDKKAAATNWIEGRGKSVVVETIISKEVVQSTLKTTVEAICKVNVNKNLIGSAMAGAIGGFNAHASNIVTAIFLATGQDPAQNVESSNCITLMEETPEGDLWMSCTMPSIEVGTVGGGTSLPAQSACLDVIGVRGGGEKAGENAQKLAHVVAAATMAGELSLLAALAANTLVQAHMQHNRKPATK
eukprot:CAMPEP_0195524884 /NCGR_PEP_ID=MMETSP0794_2-20130614/24981_1 /TAXON_ID=515487 /ORGANISM="Stephanopyxis turris, Strain CCMP 815" /LENGTH=623 /DNA_ID=CAMNT_0040655205 /DNA_START=98 /DNA_END=1969 /DNA_ORIENTATION=+